MYESNRIEQSTELTYLNSLEFSCPDGLKRILSQRGTVSYCIHTGILFQTRHQCILFPVLAIVLLIANKSVAINFQA